MQIIFLIVLIFLSAFFSMSETALFSLSRLRVKGLLYKKMKGIEIVNKLKNNTHDTLITILIGNNLVNIAASAFATSLALKIFKNNAVAIVTFGMTLLILTFGEIIPKSVATNHNVKISIFVAKPIYVLSKMLFPIVKIFEALARVFSKEKKQTLTEEDLKSIVNLGREEGTIDEIEKSLIQNVFKFNDMRVAEIMTPRKSIFAVDEDSQVGEIVEAIVKSGFSRIPVYRQNMDYFKGVLNLKDLADVLNRGRRKIKVKEIMRKPYFVPENKRISMLLRQFQKRKEHLSLVVDEYGLVVGLITLENVIEEIVGEIKDETDKIEPHVKKIGKNIWKVLGRADIDELNDGIGSSFKDRPEYHTVSGLFIYKAGKIPDVREKIQIGKYVFEVTRKEENRILEMEIKKNTK